jgi:hypothetical protein
VEGFLFSVFMLSITRCAIIDDFDSKIFHIELQKSGRTKIF